MLTHLKTSRLRHYNNYHKDRVVNIEYSSSSCEDHDDKCNEDNEQNENNSNYSADDTEYEDSDGIEEDK